MFKKSTCLIVIILFTTKLFAQTSEPVYTSGLMVDLVAYSDYRAVNGYAIRSSFYGRALKPGDQTVLIGNKKPSFSWIMHGKGNNVMQLAYQIQVSESGTAFLHGKGYIWDSGKVNSARSSGVVYEGPDLKPNTTYHWAVRLWSATGSGENILGPTGTFHTDSVLTDHRSPAYPIQITEQRPVSFTKKDKTWFADFGKDAFGQLKLTLYADKDHELVLIRLGEVLDTNGRIERKPPGTIRYSQYRLVLHRGWHTYHIQIDPNKFNTRPQAIKMPAYIGEVTPFRYVEVEDYAQDLKADDLTRLFAHYQFDDSAANFHSSDTTLNAIWELCKYSMKATSFLGTYVDGDRERIPYEADAYINQLSHYVVDREYTLARHSHEYLITHPTWPTEWNLQSVLIGWNDYLYTGDISSAKHYYQDLKAKTLSALADSLGLISTLSGKMNNNVAASIHLKDKMRDIVDWPHGAETDGFVFTKYNAVVNAFYYRSLVLMGQLAADLGNTADAKMYTIKASALKKAYQKVFFDSKRHIYKDGANTDHASLHTNMFAMAFGLVDDRYKAVVQSFIKSRGMACSVYGSQFLLDAVYDAGDAKYGFELLTSKTDRSWYNMIRVGSTITLEAWDNKYKPNQDWNHAWGAAAGNIISRKLMGIEPLTPGWTSFSVRPQIDTLSHADIDVPTIKGTIKAVYEQSPKQFDIRLSIPANMQAQVYLPVKINKKFTVMMDGKPISIKAQKQTALIPNVGSGQHLFQIRY